jgi:integrase
MSQTVGGFRAVPRPEGVTSRYSLVVVDGEGWPHLPLTRFYDLARQGLSDGAARTYLNALLPYFGYLYADEWRRHRGDCWDSPPEAVQQSVRDYLVYQLACKVRWRDTYELVSLTARSPGTVRVFLAALKLFYQIMRRMKYYPHPHPLIDTATHLIREVEEAERGVDGHRRMPQSSGVEDPLPRRTSENYFRLAQGEWVAEPIDDAKLHKRLIQGFKQVRTCLRDQIVIRMAYESGARIGEILDLTVGDWRARGASREALARSKGSHGRRVKPIRFSLETAKMLLQYLNTERAALDRERLRLDQLGDSDPLFLSRRRKPYSYEAFKPHWYRLCGAIGIDLNIHGLRHWYVTQEMRLIGETAQSAGGLKQMREELVRYMAWRNPDTLKAYDHVLSAMQHADTQDQLYKRWYEEDLEYEREGGIPNSPPMPAPEARMKSVDEQGTDLQQTDGWGDFLALGGVSNG